MFQHYFIISLFALTGSLSLLAAICNWEWFFQAQNTQWIVRRMGRNRARFFYGFIGFCLLGVAIWLVKTVFL